MIFPLSWAYESVYRIRRFCYLTGLFEDHNFSVPIISIGNLTFGGTGKTPFTIWLGNYFEANQKKVMVLMRGHKGSLENKFGILKTNKRFGRDPLKYGDEALVLTKRLNNASVVVGKNRAENLKYYFDEEQPDLVLLDDGHQHLKLRRNFNILLFDGLLDIKKYQVPPFGYLREGLSALTDADFVVIGRSNQISKHQKMSLKSMIKKYNPRVAIGEIGYKASGFYNSKNEEAFLGSDLKNKKVICFSALASPESFYNMINDYECVIIHKESFADHHYYNLEEMETLIHLSEKEDALLITTEKDIVKMSRIIDVPKLVYLKIDIEFYKNEQELKNQLNQFI